MINDDNFLKELNHYKNEVKSKLLCDSKISKAFIVDFENDIDNYIIENDVCSIDEIYNHFGTADDIANAFFLMNDVKSVKKKVNVKKLIAVLVASIIAIWAVGMVVIAINARKSAITHTVIYEVEESNTDNYILEDET